MSVEVYLRQILEEAAKVDDLARLIDAECEVYSPGLLIHILTLTRPTENRCVHAWRVYRLERQTGWSNG
jgi:hypothetical protein